MIKVTCAFLFYGNKVLITQRNADSDNPFLWEFPGGKVEPGESDEDSVIREMKEELNLDIEMPVVLNPVKFNYGFKKIQLIPFLCHVRSSKIKLTEHIQYKWADWNELNSVQLLEADKKLIQQKGNRKILKKYFGEKMNNT